MMSVANEVLTMCGRGESCLERRCWSEPALCCYSGGQNQHCAALLYSCVVGQKQHCAVLCCYSGGQNDRCAVVVLIIPVTIVSMAER